VNCCFRIGLPLVVLPALLLLFTFPPVAATSPAAPLHAALAEAASTPDPRQGANCAVSPYGAAALMAIQDKLGYIDRTGFRYQILVAAAASGGADPGILSVLDQDQNFEQGRNQVGGLRSVGARLRGGERAQLVAAFKDGGYSEIRPGEPNPVDISAAYQIVALDYTSGFTVTPALNRWRGNPPNAGFAVSGLAAGPLGFPAGADRDAVVMTTIESTEQVSNDTSSFLYLFQGADKNGAGVIDHADNTWQQRLPLTSADPSLARVAVGRLSGATTDEVATASLAQNLPGGKGIVLQVFGNRSQQLLQLATTNLLTDVNTLELTAADLDGNGRDSLVLAANIGQGTSRRVSVSTWKLVPSPTVSGTQVLSQTGSWLSAPGTQDQLALTTADLDANGSFEIVVADHQVGTSATNDLRVTSLNAATGIITRGVYLTPSFPNDPIAIVGGQIDQSGFYGVIASFRVNRGLGSPYVFYALADNADSQNALVNSGLRRVAALDDPIANGGALAVGDFNGAQRFSAEYLNQCRTIKEAHLGAVVFVPPHWTRLNASGTSGRFGRGNTETNESGQSVTVTKGGGINASFGIGFKVGVDFLFKGAENKTIFNATYAKDWFENSTRTTSQVTTTTTTNGQFNDLDFVIFDQLDYTCYNYQITEDGAPRDATALACQQASPLLWTGRDISSWTDQAGNEISSYQWMPAVREWSNLALGRTASQSSTDGTATAARAVDGRFDGVFTNGSVTKTLTETNPWWQVDLGSVQLIDTISVWNRIDECCYSNTVDFNLFVSETPFSSENPAVLAAQPNVFTFKQNGQPGPVTHVITRRNRASLRGRYVRVQVPSTTSLALAELQVFGPPHLEPDQYPVAVSDSDPDDETFNVFMRDGTTHVVHGRLLWPESGTSFAAGIPQPQVISPGSTSVNWSMRQDRTTRQLSAEERGENQSIGLQVETEFAVKPGAVVKATLGGRSSWGQRNGNTTVRAYGSNFELSGTASKLASTAPQACGYVFQPYYYETRNLSSYGFAATYRVVDYVVPQLNGSGAALEACRQQLSTPTLESDVAIGKPGSFFTLIGVGFQPNARATIAIRQPGASSFRTAGQVTLNANGQQSFVLATSASDAPGDYLIRLSTGQQSAQTTITLRADAQQLPAPSDNRTVVNATSSGIRLPLLTR
jgi:hypothetical protein